MEMEGRTRLLSQSWPWRKRKEGGLDISGSLQVDLQGARDVGKPKSKEFRINNNNILPVIPTELGLVVMQ